MAEFTPFTDKKHRPGDGEKIEVQVPSGVCRATYYHDGVDGIIVFDDDPESLFEVEEYADRTWWQSILYP